MENDAPNQRQYLTFFLADEQYAVGVLSVKEIIEYGDRDRASRPRRRTSAASSTCAAVWCRSWTWR